MFVEGRKTPVIVVAIATAILFLADWAAERAGSSTFPGGPLDETAHFLTVVLALWALGWSVRKPFWIGAVTASVLIDVDHIPDRLGAHWLTAGTPRPYTHSLIVMVGVLVIAAAWRRGRSALLGVLFGLTLHFWRDLSEPGTGVPLLWPFSDHGFGSSHALYLILVGLMAVAATLRTPEVSRFRRRRSGRGVASPEAT
jgi:hypothetical protein